MNQYLTGGMALIILFLGWQLKSSITRNGELSAKLENQVGETLECVDANASTMLTISTLTTEIKEMVDRRREDAAQRERVLDERDQALVRAGMVSDRLKEEREDEINDKPDCADLTSLRVGFFCPATGGSLRERSSGEDRNGDQDD